MIPGKILECCCVITYQLQIPYRLTLTRSEELMYLIRKLGILQIGDPMWCSNEIFDRYWLNTIGRKHVSIADQSLHYLTIRLGSNDVTRFVCAAHQMMFSYDRKRRYCFEVDSKVIESHCIGQNSKQFFFKSKFFMKTS